MENTANAANGAAAPASFGQLKAAHEKATLVKVSTTAMMTVSEGGNEEVGGWVDG